MKCREGLNVEIGGMVNFDTGSGNDVNFDTGSGNDVNLVMQQQNSLMQYFALSC